MEKSMKIPKKIKTMSRIKSQGRIRALCIGSQELKTSLVHRYFGLIQSSFCNSFCSPTIEERQTIFHWGPRKNQYMYQCISNCPLGGKLVSSLCEEYFFLLLLFSVVYIKSSRYPGYTSSPLHPPSPIEYVCLAGNIQNWRKSMVFFIGSICIFFCSLWGLTGDVQQLLLALCQDCFLHVLGNYMQSIAQTQGSQ